MGHLKFEVRLRLILVFARFAILAPTLTSSFPVSVAIAAASFDPWWIGRIKPRVFFRQLLTSWYCLSPEGFNSALQFD
jgi:hypothetical protein